MLEISHRNGSYSNPLVGPRLVSTSCQTEELISEKKSSQDKNSSSNSNKIMSSKQNPENSGNSCSELGPNSKNSSQQCSNSNCTSPLRACDGSGGGNSPGNPTGNSPGNSAENAKDSYLVMNGIQIEDAISSPQRPLSSASEESESSISEDDEISFNTIKRGTGSKLQAAMKNNQIRLADFCQGTGQTSSKLSLNTIITNPEKQQQNPFCDQEMKNSTCSVVGSSAVTNCENEQQQQTTNVNSQASSMKSDGDNSGVVVESSQTKVPQINGGTAIHSM